MFKRAVLVLVPETVHCMHIYAQRLSRRRDRNVQLQLITCACAGSELRIDPDSRSYSPAEGHNLSYYRIL